jgi:hypothetical protein
MEKNVENGVNIRTVNTLLIFLDTDKYIRARIISGKSITDEKIFYYLQDVPYSRHKYFFTS